MADRQIDYNEILTAKNAYDPVGHYSRPDVFRLLFNSNANGRVIMAEQSPAAIDPQSKEPLG
ncbi:hypothetical protein [Arthrobacter sp. ISL-72]|uniref:hypothetical protein n=1 Tax=Arthrobacter sp. ISL-72 TaxID=2819114 RepID=UPI001BE79B07|nr:hypothetical protein [Arthrobacter sp. ISL-72]MBT2595890.1 hypothetical protein [Arthrobacter sp. ISL-72]